MTQLSTSNGCASRVAALSNIQRAGNQIFAPTVAPRTLWNMGSGTGRSRNHRAVDMGDDANPNPRPSGDPRGAHPPHPERFWVSNGFDRFRAPRRRRSALYLVLALIVFWGFALVGVAVLLIEIVSLIGGMR